MIARLLISPSLEARVEEMEEIIKEMSLSKSHPDLLYFPNDSKLGIEQARKIKEHFSLKPYSIKGRVVVLEDASVLTVEAQNALLKILEEPPHQALMLLGAPTDSKFLPTILSRCQVIRIQSSEFRVQNLEFSKDIEKLLKASIEERFEYVERLKDREELLHALTRYFRDRLIQMSSDPLRLVGNEASRGTNGTEFKNFLQEILQAEEWAEQNVNIRAILEYLMLVMPQKL